MTELLPCPFCGGRQTYRKHDGGVWLTTTNHKRGCIMRDALAFVAFDTEAEAIEAWNTRADDYRQAAEYWQRMYEETFAERTCELVRQVVELPDSLKNLDVDISVYECSRCGEPAFSNYNYCPNCGAKVVGE